MYTIAMSARDKGGGQSLSGRVRYKCKLFLRAPFDELILNKLTLDRFNHGYTIAKTKLFVIYSLRPSM